MSSSFQELVVAFHGQIIQFENNFCAVAVQFLEEDRKRELSGSSPRDSSKKGWILVGQGSSNKEAFMASTDSHTLKRHSGSGNQSMLTHSGVHGGGQSSGQLTPGIAQMIGFFAAITDY